MLAFEIHINGQKCYTAGGAYETLITGITKTWTSVEGCASESVNFNVSGVNSVPVQFASWPMHELKKGDRVEIRVIESTEITPPSMEQIDAPDMHTDA